MTFVPFPKIGRLSREIVITEKIDGTNAQVFIRTAAEEMDADCTSGSALVIHTSDVPGSEAAPGFMHPEGVVIFHSQSGALFKKTFENDEAGKGREPLAEMAA